MKNGVNSIFLNVALGEQKIIPKDFAEKNKKLASYQNRLVHMYWEVSEKEICKITREHLDDLDDFCQHYLNYVRIKKQNHQL